MDNNIFLITVAVLVMALSGLFAGSETGIYQLSRLRLRLGIERKKLSFIMLGKLMRDSSGLLISILIGTNLAHYIVTSIVTHIFLGRLESEHSAELFATLLTAPVIFIFCEIIPKSIFYHRADRFVPYVAPVLFVFKKLFTWIPMVPLLKSISNVFARMTGSAYVSKTAMTAIRSSHIRAIMHETHEEGFLSSVQTEIMNRLQSISNLSIRYVMTPSSRVEIVDVNTNRDELLKILNKSAFTRLPVYEDEQSNITGFINIYEVLNSSEDFTDLRGFVKDIRKVSADTIVTDAINIMQSEQQKIVLVIRDSHLYRQKAIGIVTMKDLVEELLGELSEW